TKYTPIITSQKSSFQIYVRKFSKHLKFLTTQTTMKRMKLD
ncbi:hypothetical protein, partial [Bacillus phage SPG24]